MFKPLRRRVSQAMPARPSPSREGTPQLELVAGPGQAQSMTDVLAICG